MSTFEKRSVIDASTERVFQYITLPDTSVWPGLLEVRDVHRLIDGVSYMQRVYATNNLPVDDLNIQLQFEADETALTTQLRDLDLVMTWSFQPDRQSAPRVLLDGDHTFWSPN